MVIVSAASVKADELRRLISFSVSSRMASSTFSAHIARSTESDMQYLAASTVKTKGFSATEECHSSRFRTFCSLRLEAGEYLKQTTFS